MTDTSAHSVAALARAFDIDPADVRSDTPLDAIGWIGSATDWLLAADHLGVRLASDPPQGVEVTTIADVIAIVMASGDVQASSSE